MEEFTDVCCYLGEKLGREYDPETIKDLQRSIDFNHDGFITFNEFLEAFRLVNGQVNTEDYEMGDDDVFESDPEDMDEDIDMDNVENVSVHRIDETDDEDEDNYGGDDDDCDLVE